MSQVSLIRSTRFSAGHRYWRPEWSDQKNRKTFGASSHSHGHNYRLEITVRGDVDAETGFCVDLARLDRVLEEVVERLDQRDVGEVVPEFAPGGRIPTTEELARWFFRHLEDRIPAPARLARVRLEESETLAAEYAPGGEGVTVPPDEGGSHDG